MKIINKRKIFLIISGILVLTSVLLWIAVGLDYGIDFTGGALLEVEYIQDRPVASQVRESLAELNLEGLNVQQAGENGYLLRFKEIDEEMHQAILAKLIELGNSKQGGEATEELPESTDTQPENGIVPAENNDIISDVVVVTDTPSSAVDVLTEKRFEAIGPSIGQELKSKAVWAIILVLIAIICYVGWAFRKVSYPITSWKYGVVAIIALFHDILITIGIFVFLGKYFGLEVNTPFVAALLTILGYSVNDTIVIFDRIRENLHKYEGEFEEIVDKSILESVTRSINTALTTELVLIAIVVFGGATIRDFVLALAIGIFFGTYSSIFIASPLLVIWQKLDWRLKKS